MSLWSGQYKQQCQSKRLVIETSSHNDIEELDALQHTVMQVQSNV
jgi:hypothetical protein